MKTLVTGAAGFLGKKLVEQLMHNQADGDVLAVLDLNLSVYANKGYSQILQFEGSLTDSSVIERLQSTTFDVVYHLAGVTSQISENQFEVGFEANVMGSLNLMNVLKAQANFPKLVFTSSIGVYGVPLPERVTDETPIQPTLSYGSQKRAIEILLADYARRGFVDARTVRLPGVIARPANSIKAFSTFSSDILNELLNERNYECPVSENATNWLISIDCCIEQLQHAASLDGSVWPKSRVVNLPSQCLKTKDLVAGLENVLDKKLSHLVQWNPIAQIEAQFGNWPPLETGAANKLGFQHDGSPENLVKRAIRWL